MFYLVTLHVSQESIPSSPVISGCQQTFHWLTSLACLPSGGAGSGTGSAGGVTPGGGSSPGGGASAGAGGGACWFMDGANNSYDLSALGSPEVNSSHGPGDSYRFTACGLAPLDDLCHGNVFCRVRGNKMADWTLSPDAANPRVVFEKNIIKLVRGPISCPGETKSGSGKRW